MAHLQIPQSLSLQVGLYDWASSVVAACSSAIFVIVTDWHPLWRLTCQWHINNWDLYIRLVLLMLMHFTLSIMCMQYQYLRECSMWSRLRPAFASRYSRSYAVASLCTWSSTTLMLSTCLTYKFACTCDCLLIDGWVCLKCRSNCCKFVFTWKVFFATTLLCFCCNSQCSVSQRCCWMDR